MKGMIFHSLEKKLTSGATGRSHLEGDLTLSIFLPAKPIAPTTAGDRLSKDFGKIHGGGFSLTSLPQQI